MKTDYFLLIFSNFFKFKQDSSVMRTEFTCSRQHNFNNIHNTQSQLRISQLKRPALFQCTPDSKLLNHLTSPRCSLCSYYAIYIFIVLLRTFIFFYIILSRIFAISDTRFNHNCYSYFKLMLYQLKKAHTFTVYASTSIIRYF